jgi:Lipase (class 3)
MSAPNEFHTPATAAPPEPPATVGTATWTIPLRVGVSIGPPQLVSPQAPAVGPPPAEALFRRRKPASAREFFSRFAASSLSSAGFGWRTSLTVALASALSYDSPASVESTARGAWKLETCNFIDRDDMQCFVASTAARALVAFRGTESLGDWLANLNALSTRQPYGDVHRGFHAGFAALRSPIELELKKLPDRKIVLTGHSLGGALATIAAAEWRGIFPVAAIYTFGQPGVGKGIFPAFMRQHYDGSFFRFVNDDDIVPRVPPGYKHVGTLFHFDASSRLKAGIEGLAIEAANEPPMMSEAEFDRLRAQLLERRAAHHSTVSEESPEAPVLEGLLPSISDHSLDAYVAKIAAMTKAG